MSYSKPVCHFADRLFLFTLINKRLKPFARKKEDYFFFIQNYKKILHYFSFI